MAFCPSPRAPLNFNHMHPPSRAALACQQSSSLLDPSSAIPEPSTYAALMNLVAHLVALALSPGARRARRPRLVG